MASVNFFFEYRNELSLQLPVNPEKLEVQVPGANSTVNIVNLGDVSILKTPGLKKIEFESFIPTAVTASYVQKGVTVLSPEAYRDFFEAIQRQKDPVNFVVTGLNVNLQMSVEDFSFWWSESDQDMHFKISLQEYRKHTVKIATISASTTNQTPATNSRANNAKKVTVGATVRVNGRLHRDSYGAGPGQTEKNATRKVNFIKKGRACPYHVTTLEGGWRGWVTEDSVEVID